MDISLVDAFTAHPYSGNPAAVCVLKEEKSDEWMQKIAAEMNLSETAFLIQQEENSFSLRWFTPAVEVPLCGHATLASSHRLWETGAVKNDEIRFHTKSGLLTAKKEADWIQLDFPALPPKETQPPEALLKSIDAEFLYVGTNGVKYLVEVAESETVEKLSPDFEMMKRIDTQGVIVTAKANEPGIDFVSRYFAPAVGINEDPVTGSAHCCLGPYWSAKLGKTHMAAKQLSKRRGFLKLEVTDERVLMSGQAVTTLSGTLCTEK
jgi:PhzF family phenazine biosynthesis protein